MKRDAAGLPRLEWLLAGLLRYGTWLASAWIAVGLALAFIAPRGTVHAALPAGMPIVTAGIAFFILLPVLRVICMLVFFISQRDYRFIAISAVVLLILTLGLLVGLRLASPPS